MKFTSKKGNTISENGYLITNKEKNDRTMERYKVPVTTLDKIFQQVQYVSVS